MIQGASTTRFLPGPMGPEVNPAAMARFAKAVFFDFRLPSATNVSKKQHAGLCDLESLTRWEIRVKLCSDSFTGRWAGSRLSEFLAREALVERSCVSTLLKSVLEVRDPSGEFIPMSALSPTSIPPLNSPSFDTASSCRGESHPVSTEILSEAGVARALKRAVDVAGACTALLFLTPIMLLIAVLIRLDSGRPILFRQARRGHRGRVFQVLKFRTMVVDAEKRLKDLEHSNESAGGVLFKLKKDPRVTPLGAFLRRYSLDELPQFINVLRGEMSLVGPRPLQLRDSELLALTNPAAYARRLEVMPGITGPWQVGGRSELDHEQMVDLDLDYVQNWSMSRDLAILCKTFVVVLLRRGAY